MGEYADLALNADIEIELEERFSRETWVAFRYANPTIWLQKNGQCIRVEDMTTSHLMNSIAMLERADHDYSDCPVLHNMKKEVIRRFNCLLS